MAKKTAMDRLAAEISGMLEEYGEDVQANLEEITKRMGAQGAKALRLKSREALKTHTGEYAKVWKYALHKTKRMRQARTTIYNDHYALPHLLEHGHDVKRGGEVIGHAKPHPHVAPIADKLVRTFEKEVREKL